MGIGTRIRQARTAVGLSIRGLAALLEVSHATAGHWETEVHAPSVATLLRIAEITGTDAGWLLFTHGVGAMRKYALGCALLDLDDPSKLIGRVREPVLTAVDADRAGYVPNVIYTCGALRVGSASDGRLLVPYGISDSAVGFATVTIRELLDLMV